MRRQDEAQLHTPPIPEDEAFTLESILAEYGKGGRQPAQTEEAPVPQPAPEPVSYTQLDVYKRQAQAWPRAERP